MELKDHFDEEISYFSMPCSLCTHRHKEAIEWPCNECVHNMAAVQSDVVSANRGEM